MKGLILAVILASNSLLPGMAGSWQVPTVAFIPNASHHYTFAELNGMSKQDLISLVSTLQSARESEARTSTVAAMPNAKKGIAVQLLRVFATQFLAGSLARRSFNGLAYGPQQLQPQITYDLMAANGQSTCDPSVSFTCTPYPLHQNTCSTIQVFNTALSSGSPALANSKNSAATQYWLAGGNLIFHLAQIWALCDNGPAAVSKTPTS